MSVKDEIVPELLHRVSSNLPHLLSVLFLSLLLELVLVLVMLSGNAWTQVSQGLSWLNTYLVMTCLRNSLMTGPRSECGPQPGVPSGGL